MRIFWDCCFASKDRDSYWKMMHKYIGSDITSMVTLPVLIFEPMTMLQKMAEVCNISFRECFCQFCASYIVLLNVQCVWQIMEYSYLLDRADECEDPYMRLVYACESSFTLNFYLASASIAWSFMVFMSLIAASWAISVYYAYQRTWKPFNPILGETYEMSNHGGVAFIAEQVGCKKYTQVCYEVLPIFWMVDIYFNFRLVTIPQWALDMLKTSILLMMWRQS